MSNPRGRPPKPDATPAPNSMAAVLQYERQKRGLNFHQWAKLLGVNYSTVRRWEDGDNRPTIEQLRNLVDAGVQADKLLRTTT